MNRKLNSKVLAAKQRLERNLDELCFYCCHPESMPLGEARNSFVIRSLLRGNFDRGIAYWPVHALLEQIHDDVILLAPRRKNPSAALWKAFEQVDKRFRKLRLALRVGNLISRARAMLPGESELSKLLRLDAQGDVEAECKLKDMILKRQKLAAALEADRQVERLRCLVQPLACWTLFIEHPMAEDFACIAGFDHRRWRDSYRRSYRRFLQSARVRRWRKKYLSKNVTPISDYTRGKASLP